MAETAGAPLSVLTYTHTSTSLAIEVAINPSTNRLTIHFATNPGTWSVVGTDGVILATGDEFPVDADSPFTFVVNEGVDRRGGMKIYTQVLVQPTVVKLISEEV